ncbi:MAG: diguanylate cyclase [Steroidobacteraceae bacterium]
MTEANADRWVAIVSDPDRQASSAIEGLLDPLGFEIVAAPYAEDVTAAVQHHRRALILAAMPDDGDRMAEQCQQWHEVAKQCYVTVLLERYCDKDVATAFESGADDVMVKPVIPAELRARMTRAVQVMLHEDYRARLSGEAVLLSEISVRSPLHSRRYLQEQLGNEMDRAKRFAHALALILVEVVGTRPDERLLRNFGVFLNSYVRVHVDWVARYTDRTFALVLPETTLLGAVRAAHRLRAILNESALRAAGLPSQLNVSFGVSAVDEVSAAELPDTATLMTSAEVYLQEAVRTGPDRIIAGRPQITH